MSEIIVADARNVTIGDKPLLPSFHLVATNPQQMQAAQADLAQWLKDKIAAIDAEILEVETARSEAKKHKWKTSTFSSVLSKYRGRRMFYSKTLDAVELGMTIVPNFPIDVFAIRVMRDAPSSDTQYNYNNPAWAPTEREDIAATGEGEYVSPIPSFRRSQYPEKDSQGKDRIKHYLYPTGFKDAEFPIIAAHPSVMSATALARDMKLFDRIGICPASRRGRHGKGDPLIIGQIVRKEGWSEKVVSFLIAWHLDLRTL